MFDPEPNRFAGRVEVSGFRGGYILSEHGYNLPENSPVFTINTAPLYHQYHGNPWDPQLWAWNHYGTPIRQFGLSVTHNTYTAH